MWIVSPDRLTVQSVITTPRDFVVAYPDGRRVSHPRAKLLSRTEAQLNGIDVYFGERARFDSSTHVVVKRLGWRFEGNRFYEEIETAEKPAPAEPTEEDIADQVASAKLSRKDFFEAIDSVLDLGPGDPQPDDYLVIQIQNSLIDEGVKRQAELLIRNAVEFWRHDPDHPDLLDELGYGVLGLSPTQIDRIFYNALRAA